MADAGEGVAGAVVAVGVVVAAGVVESRFVVGWK